ncbi:MAG: hypothetical protein NTV80_05205, partial [Verrucomicrobia bacterium]|nr:hypothetical protein [Verrucomicrobiota bacterium]
MIRSSFWLVSLLFILPLSVLADVSLESLMRSYQERYKVSKANVAKVWPANPASEAAPEFPPDGFYTRGVSDPVIDAAYQALRQGVINGMFDGVNDVTTADKLMDDWLLDGDLEGVHFTSFNSSSALKSFEKPITLSLDEKSKMAIIARRLTKMQWRVAKMNVDYKFYEGVALANDPVASINAAMINALAASPMQSSEIDAFFSPYSWRYKVTLTPYPPVNTVYEGQYAFLKAKATRESSLSAASNPTLVEYRPYYTLFTASDLAATDTPPIKVFRSLPEGEEVTWHPIIPAAPTAGGTGVVFSGKPLFYATARYKFRYIPEEGCGCASCAPGFVEAKANSLHFRLGLGLTDGAQSSAALEITAEVPGSLLAKPEGLYLPTGRGVTVVRGGSPLALKQIVTAEHVVEVTAETARRYHLDWYKRSAGAPAGGTGLYPRSSTRLSRLTVENPNAANANTLNVKRYEGAATVAARTWTFVYSTSTHTWSLTDSLNAYEEKVINSAITVSGITYATEDRQTLQGTTLVRHTRQKFQNYAFGKVLVEEVNDPNGKNDLTTMSYYTNSATDGVNYGRVKQVVQPSGAWKRYEYDQAGRVIKTVSSYLDSPLTAAESAVRVMTTSYQSPTQAYTLMIETIQGIEISRRYTVERLDGMDDILCTVPGATVNAASNLVTSSTNYLSGAFAGRLKSVINPDGTGQLLTYSADVVNAVTGLLDAAEITTVTKTGGWNGARTVIAVGSQTTSRSNRQGQVVESKTIDIASGLTTAHTQATAFDDYGRVLTQLNVLSAQTTQTVYDCCGLQSMTNERGLTTTYTRSATEEAQTTAGVTTKTVISGLTTIGLRQGSDGSWLELGRQTLNVAGESVSSHSRGTGLVTETHTHDTANQREVHTRTYADGGINVDTSYPDGTALRSTGTATRPMQHEVGVQAGVSIDGV